MNQARAFELAGMAPDLSDAFTKGRHGAPTKLHATQFDEAYLRETLAGFTGLVFAVYPAAMTYRPDMPEEELRAWAAGIMEALT